MKLPRWLVISMLTSSVLSVLAAAGWWWVTWPERTAREFDRLLREGNVPLEFDMHSPLGLQWANVPDRGKRIKQELMKEKQIEPMPRTVLDVILGRQRFQYFYHGRDGREVEPFVVQRGKVFDVSQ